MRAHIKAMREYCDATAPSSVVVVGEDAAPSAPKLTSPDEMIEALFAKFDVDQDEFLSKTEYRECSGLIHTAGGAESRGRLGPVGRRPVNRRRPVPD